MTYTIKPLEWEESNGGKNWHARSPYQNFSVWEYGEDCWWAVDMLGPSRPCNSIEDGKARAEAYYRLRLLVALEPVPSGASVVGVHGESAPEHKGPPGSQRG